jgi:hypothetical protein
MDKLDHKKHYIGNKCKSMIQRMYQAYRIVGKTFGTWLSPIGTLFIFFLLRLINSLAMMLDGFIFPKLCKKQINNPIIIGGCPRSGTTFLHRFLISQGIGSGTNVWRMIFPSLILQKITRPLLPLIERISPVRHHMHTIHKTNLTLPETDDPASLFRFFDGFFLYGFLLAWAENEFIEDFFPENRNTVVRDLNWLEKVWKRNLLFDKRDRVLSKYFSIGLYLPAFVERFPDLRIIYLIRDPVQTVPSTLSLIAGVIDNRYGFWRLPEMKRQRYIDRIYSALLILNQRFLDIYFNDKTLIEHVLVVQYDRMMENFEDVMTEILSFLKIDQSRQLNNAIRNVAKQQRKYTSKHQYDCSHFKLSEDQIRKDYASIYDAFLS